MMTEVIGARRWAIAEGYIPEFGTGPEPEMTSHETACVLNASSDTAFATDPRAVLDLRCRCRGVRSETAGGGIDGRRPSGSSKGRARRPER